MELSEIRKYMLSKIPKLLKLIGGSVLVAEELKSIWETQEVTISLINNLKASGYTDMVQNSSLEVEAKCAKGTAYTVRPWIF